MEAARLTQKPEPKQLEVLASLVDPFVQLDRAGFEAKFAWGPEVVEDALIATTGLLAVSKQVSAWCGRIDKLRGNHRHKLWELQIRDYYTAYTAAGPKDRYVQRYTFRWDEQAVYCAERDVVYGGIAGMYTRPLESELDRLDSFDPEVEFNVKPILRSFNEVTERDANQLIVDLDAYVHQAVKVL